MLSFPAHAGVPSPAHADRSALVRLMQNTLGQPPLAIDSARPGRPARFATEFGVDSPVYVANKHIDIAMASQSRSAALDAKLKRTRPAGIIPLQRCNALHASTRWVHIAMAICMVLMVAIVNAWFPCSYVISNERVDVSCMREDSKQEELSSGSVW